MKRNITTLLVVLMSMLGMPALAHDIEVANDDGVTIYYNFRNDNTELSVTYRGEWPNSDWSTYKDRYTGHVAIPASVTYQGKTYPVTEVGYYAFGCCNNLTAVTIPNSVTRLDNDAFSQCTSLIRPLHSLNMLNIDNQQITF